MIKVTTLDGTEMYINCDLIELIAETPDTHITLSNGNRYLVQEPARVLIGRITHFKSSLLRSARRGGTKRYLRKNEADSYQPPRKTARD